MKIYKVAGIGMTFWVSAALAMDPKTGSPCVEPATPSFEIGTPQSWVTLDTPAVSPLSLPRPTPRDSSLSSLDACTTMLPIASTKQPTTTGFFGSWFGWPWGPSVLVAQELQSIPNASLRQIEKVFEQPSSPLGKNNQFEEEQAATSRSTTIATKDAEPIQAFAAATLIMTPLSACSTIKQSPESVFGVLTTLARETTTQEESPVYEALWTHIVEKTAQSTATCRKEQRVKPLGFIGVQDYNQPRSARAVIATDEMGIEMPTGVDEKEVRGMNYQRKIKGREKQKHQKMAFIEAVRRQRRASYRQAQSCNLLYMGASVKASVAREKQKQAHNNQQKLVDRDWQTYE